MIDLSFIPDDFNYYIYKILNKDLENMNELECKEHYLIYGMKESRNYKFILPDDFNFIEYKYLNKDLENMTKLECKEHYLTYGILESRPYKFNVPCDFNYIEYKYLNKDLNFDEMNELDCKEHYSKYGIAESREYKFNIPYDFNYSDYKYLNKDLDFDGMNELHCKEHYLKYGIHESRKYKFNVPCDFNYINYKYLNKDLGDINESECKDHYLTYGIHESREYKYDIYYNLFEDFDYNEYKFLNKDLENLTEVECKDHYLKHGFKECRNYNKIYLIKLYILYYYNNSILDIDISNITDENINSFKNIINSINNIPINLLEIYIMLEKYYNLQNDTELKINDIYHIISCNKKEHFRYICYRYLNYMKNRKIDINYDLNNHNETVFIEFRILHHIEFNIRNMCYQLPNWKHTIICGNNNYNFIKKICDEISDKINIIKIDKDNINIDDYSKLLTSTYFWALLTGNHILIHQEDSLIFDANGIDKWLKYDYVGAPWPEDIYDKSYLVGNGGFSLRKRDTMIYICNNYDINNYEIFEFTKNYMNENGLLITPEDCFFVKCIVDNNLGLIPDYEEAKYFSSESIKCEESLGGHAFWLSDNEWIRRFNKIIKQFSCIGLKYIKDYCHRFGWNNLLMILYINDIITIYNKNDNIELIDLCEKFFIWNNSKIDKKWIGILHLTPCTPDYLNNLNIIELFNNNNFKNSIKYCIKLITLSDYLKKYVTNNINNNIEIIKLYHPIKNVDKYFSLDDYLNNNNKYIIQIGQQLRIFKTFLNLQFTTHNKLWTCNDIYLVLKHLNNELGIQLNSVSELYDYLKNYNVVYKKLTNKDYDELITKNIIFLHLYDASANNTLLEAIVYKVPIVINKHGAIIEYLGVDYPLYYNEISEVDDNFIKDERIIAAYNYLYNYDNSKIMYKNFCKELLENLK
jgi:hypothetical protein